jgi:predicted dehydrogenase
LVAVCDVVKNRVNEVGERFGATPYVRYASMLEAHDFDIIDICTQNRLHCAMTLSALKAGAHVLVEKPMAMNADECKAMIRAAKAKKRKLMVAQHMRFEAGNERLKAVVQRGELGRVYSANAVYLRRRGIPGWGRFHIKRESLGGPLIDIGVHVMDLCMWLMGFPKPVSASGKVWRMFGDRKDLVNCWGTPYPPKEFDVEDHATALVRFENEITMLVEVSWAANVPEERHGVMVLGDKAGISTNPLGVYGYQDGALTSRKFDWMEKQEGHRMEIRHFTECLERDRPVRVQPAESLQVQKVIDAIYESSKKNREVRIR